MVARCGWEGARLSQWSGELSVYEIGTEEPWNRFTKYMKQMAKCRTADTFSCSRKCRRGQAVIGFAGELDGALKVVNGK